LRLHIAFPFLIHRFLCVFRLKVLSPEILTFLTHALNCGDQSASCTPLQSYTADFTRGEGATDLSLSSKSQKPFLSVTPTAFAHSLYSGYTSLGVMERYNWGKIARAAVEKTRLFV